MTGNGYQDVDGGKEGVMIHVSQSNVNSRSSLQGAQEIHATVDGSTEEAQEETIE